MTSTPTEPVREATDAHEGPIKTPKQLVVTVVLSFIVPIAIILLLVNFVTLGKKEASGSDAFTPAEIAARLKPVGSIEIKDLNDPSTMKTGEQVFAGQCSTCHASGAVGAPKFGDATAWEPRVTKGYEALLQSALHGKGNMGPQGGGDYSDFEIGRAVVYMANHGGGHLSEPQMSAAAASGPSDGAAASAPAAAASGAG